MSRLITKLGDDLGLTEEGYVACWVTDFPMFEEALDKEDIPLEVSLRISATALSMFSK